MSSSTKRPRAAVSPSPTPISTPSLDQKPPIKWHELHCDIVLDIVLVSKDGVHFRASSFALKRESTLFQGVLDNIPHPYQTEADAIPLDYSASAIALFLDDYCAATNPARYDPLNLLTFREYLTLLRYLDCDRFIEVAVTKYQSMAYYAPIEWLAVASAENDIRSGAEALKRCQGSLISLDTRNVYEIVGRVHERWHLPLLKALFYSKDGGKEGLLVGWPDRERVAMFVADVKRRG